MIGYRKFQLQLLFVYTGHYEKFKAEWSLQSGRHPLTLGTGIRKRDRQIPFALISFTLNWKNLLIRTNTGHFENLNSISWAQKSLPTPTAIFHYMVTQLYPFMTYFERHYIEELSSQHALSWNDSKTRTRKLGSCRVELSTNLFTVPGTNKDKTIGSFVVIIYSLYFSAVHAHNLAAVISRLFSFFGFHFRH